MVVQNSLFKKTLPVLLALLIVIALGLGAYHVLGMTSQTFPRTAQEKSVTSEVVYCTENHLQTLNTMAVAVDKALLAAERYLASGSTEETALQNTFTETYQMLENCDLDACAPTDGLIQRVSELSGTPFLAAELVAMHDALTIFQKDWVGNLAYIQFVVSPDSFRTDTTRLSILDNYRTLLEETLKEHAYSANKFLLPITDRSALSEFFNEILPMLTRVPLSATTWSTDKEALEAAINTSFNREEEIIRDLYSQLGVIAVQNDALRENLIRGYMSIDMSREEAEQYVGSQLQFGFQDAFEDLLPAEEDDEDALWYKLARLVGAGYYSGAQECLVALEELADPADQNAQAYLPALRLFVTAIAPLSDIDYGVMVVGWADPDTPNNVYEIGDIIVSVNGEVCRTYEEYSILKAALTEDAFKVIVIRLDDEGKLGTAVLDLNTGMPPVHLRTLFLFIHSSILHHFPQLSHTDRKGWAISAIRRVTWSRRRPSMKKALP